MISSALSNLRLTIFRVWALTYSGMKIVGDHNHSYRPEARHRVAGLVTTI